MFSSSGITRLKIRAKTSLLGNLKDQPIEIKIKICNKVFLDPDKIINYNGTEFGKDTYWFLVEAIAGNYTFDDSTWVTKNHMNNRFFLSQRIVKEFLMDVDQFMISCVVDYSFKNCSEIFHFYDEPRSPCFEGTVSLMGQGHYHNVNIYFYFNPHKTLGKYSRTIGANVVVDHPETYTPSVAASYIGPGEALIVPVTIVHKKQETSFSKSKCVSKQGLEMQNFTGEPFQTLYSPSTCHHLCFAEAFYKLCHCVPFTGLNVTKTECLEREHFRECLKDPNVATKAVSDSGQCKQKCVAKCEQKLFYTNPRKEDLNADRQSLMELLGELNYSNARSPMAARILQDVSSSHNISTALERNGKNVAQLSIFVPENSPIMVIESVQIMTLYTFTSNIGGLLGMWLGLSVISVLQYVECFIKKVMLYFKGFEIRKNKVGPANSLPTD